MLCYLSKKFCIPAIFPKLFQSDYSTKLTFAPTMCLTRYGTHGLVANDINNKKSCTTAAESGSDIKEQLRTSVDSP